MAVFGLILGAKICKTRQRLTAKKTKNLHSFLHRDRPSFQQEQTWSGCEKKKVRKSDTSIYSNYPKSGRLLVIKFIHDWNFNFFFSLRYILCYNNHFIQTKMQSPLRHHRGTDLCQKLSGDPGCMSRHWERNGKPLTGVCCYGNFPAIQIKMANKESDAQEYLKKHRIMELFENLTAQLIYERPGEYFKKRRIVFSCCLNVYKTDKIKWKSLHVSLPVLVCSTEDPKAYMKQFLEKLKDARTVQRNYPCIFDDSNVRSLFGMLDVTGKGFITYEQYKQGQFFCLYFLFGFMDCLQI